MNPQSQQGRSLNIDPTAKQYEAWQALNDPSIADIYYGGAAGGGKTWLGCESRLARAYAYPGYKSFIGRNQLKRLMASAYVSFGKVMKFHKIADSEWHLNQKYNYIEFRNGSRIDLLDLAHMPSDPMYERLGSLEYTDGWIEEAGEVPFMAVDILQSRVGRHLNEEYKLNPDTLYTFNPNKGWVRRVYKQYESGTLPEDAVFIHALYSDNPFTADIYGKQLNRIKDKAMRMRLKEGSFDYDSDPSCLIQSEAIEDLFFNVPDEDLDDGKGYVIVDVSRHGVDKTVMYYFEGYALKEVQIYQDQGTDVTATKTIAFADKRRVPRSRILYDEDGIGGGALDQTQGAKGYLGNSSPLPNPDPESEVEEENFTNLRAQMHYKTAELINDRVYCIDVDPDDFYSEVPGITYEVWKDMLIEELEAIKSKSYDTDSKKRVRPKEEVKDEIGRSPDFSDTLVMRTWFEYKRKTQEEGVHQHIPSHRRR